MVRTRIFATPDVERAKAAKDGNPLPIALYEVGRPSLAGVGHELPHAAGGLPRPQTVRAWDFLSIALAVFATDRFVLRAAAEDAWTRVVDLEVELAEPAPWQAQAERFAAALRFLTGD